MPRLSEISTIFAAKFDNNQFPHMLKRLDIRLLSLCLMLIIALAASAQRPQTTERLNRTGQVTVDAPKELEKRNNADLGKQQQSTTKDKDKKVKEKDKKKTEPESKEEKLNDLDEDDNNTKKEEEKKKEEKKKEEITPKKPKRTHTSQQTIENRGVGFRIQAYTDNNTNAKAAAQKRARDIAMKFPQYRSYISYKAPSWRLRIGDFKTQREAQEALRRIKSVYPNFAREMVIVRDRINIWSND